MSVGAVNKQTGERIPTAGMPAIDSVLSGTSTNPVQNRVVKAALDDKQDKYDTITYAEWQAMTPEQQAAKDYYISDYPSSVLTAGNISYDNTSSGMAANKVQGAIDELKSGLTSVENTVDKIPTSGDIWFPAVFTSTAHGGNYFAPLNSLPAHATATLAAVNELGVGDLTLADFILEANDEHSQSYIYTTNSAHAGKVCSAKITFT